jgi:sugar-specific transcriptional regulator TrmB
MVSSSPSGAMRPAPRIPTISLDNFGLTDYESRAYISLIRHGTLTSSQLARFSQIPRCKAYSVVRNLKSKGFVEIERGIPLKFRSVPPEECLESSVFDEEKRVKEMRRAVSKLKMLRDESSQPAKIEEGKYLVLGQQAVRRILSEKMLACRRYIHCVVDSWGCRMVEQLSDSIISLTVASEVDFRIVLRWQFDIDWAAIKLPTSVQIRVTKCHSLPDVNFFSFDDGGLMIIDSKSGGGIFLSVPNLGSVIEETVFQHLWSSAIRLNEFLSIARVRAGEEIFDLSDRTTSGLLFVNAVATSVFDEETVVRIGENYLQLVGARINLSEDSEGIFALLTTLLSHELGEKVEVRFDTMTGMLTIDGTNSQNGIPPSPWLFAIIALSKRAGGGVTVFPELGMKSGLCRAKIIQVRLSNPLTVS